jgi:hypothetical protein
VGVIIGSYVILVALLQIPAFQRGASSIIADALSNKLNTKVSVERVDMGLFNRVVAYNINIEDQKHKPMLHVGLAAVKISILPLFKGNVIIHTAQLFDFNANLYKENSKAKPNYQFVLDAFASKDKKKKTSLELCINTLLIRRGNIVYNQFDEPNTFGKFNLHHLNIANLNANVVIKVLNSDSLNFKLKQLRLKEQSGLDIRSLSLFLAGNKRKIVLSQFRLTMPYSDIKIDTLCGYYDKATTLVKMPSRWSGNFKRSRVTLSDFGTFVPALKVFKAPFWFSVQINGFPTSIYFHDIRLDDENRDLQILAHATLSHYAKNDAQPLRVSSEIKQCTINGNGWRFIFHNIKPDAPDVPPIITRLGNVEYQGKLGLTATTLNALGILKTSLGSFDTKFSGQKNGSFNAKIVSNGFNLGQLLGEEQKFGQISLNVNTDGLLNGKKSLINAHGTIGEFSFNKYLYHNIEVDGTYHAGNVKGVCSVEDPNGKINVKGSANLGTAIPSFNLEASVANLKPYTLNLTKKYPSTSFSGAVNANLSGNNIDNLHGTVSVHKFVMERPNDTYRFDSLNIQATQDNHVKRIDVRSDFMNAHIWGTDDYRSLIDDVKHILNKNLPSFVKDPLNQRNLRTDDNCSFTAEVYKGSMLNSLFNIPLQLNKTAFINGTYEGKAKSFSINGFCSDFFYNGTQYVDTRINCTGNEQATSILLNAKKRSENKSLALDVSATAQKDMLNTNFSWNNLQNKQNYSGKFSCKTHFIKKEGSDLSMQIHILPSEMIVNDSVWNIHSSRVDYHGKIINVHDFLVDHRGQHLAINGLVSSESKDSLVADLKDIDLKYVFNIVNFHTVEFGGKATGKVYSTRILNNPTFNTKLHVNDFTLNDGPLGKMDVEGRWDKEHESVLFDAMCDDSPNNASTAVNGKVVIKKGIDLTINARRTNLYFLNYFTKNIFTNLNGRVTGWVRIFGPFKNINMEGACLINEASTKVNAINTDYFIRNDSAYFTPGLIVFPHVTLYDKYGSVGQKEHSAILNGKLMHNHFSQLSYQFNIEGNNILAYDVHEFGDNVFYGTVYGNGKVGLSGHPGTVDIDINAQPSAHTILTYNSATPDAIADGQFVKFTKPKEDTLSLYSTSNNNTEQKDEEDDVSSDLHINFLLDVTPEATMKIIMDPVMGDYINLNGAGDIRATYYNKGRFQMFGTYTVDHGIYKLSLQDVIHKDFQFKRGGTITFSGLPRQGDLNLQAVHTVNSVSLNDLSQGMFNQSNVRVNCIMNLTGKASAPVVSFDLDLPNSNEDEKQMVRSLISTNEEKNLQIIYLLGIGRFYTTEANRANTDQSQSSVAMKSLLSSTLSGQLNQVLSNAIHSNNWNFGTNLSTGEKGWSDMDVEGLLSGKLLNNRLLFNGNFGYRESQTSTSNFIGDFDLQWLITKNGSFSLKAYNATNDRYFTKSSLTTQGLGVILKKDFDSWWDLFKFKKRIRK